MSVLPFILIVLLVFCSAFFSGSEISYASASEIKLRKAMEENKTKSKSFKKAYDIFIHYDLALIAILVGNNLVNIASSAVATVIAVSLLGSSGAWVATLIMTIVIIIFGEITPKLAATRNPEGFATKVSPALSLWMVITKPIVYLSKKLINSVSKIWKEDMVDSAVTEDDLETIIDTVEEEGVVDEDTADLLQGALDFDDTPVYEIITPRVDMDAVDLDDDKEKILKKILSTKYSRIPAYRETPDHIAGILHVVKILRVLAAGGELNIEEMMMPPQFVYKTTPLDQVLELMQKSGCHIVIVTDEYGGTMGFVTMEDILEQLVGEIFDEKDTFDEEFIELGEDRFEVDGDMRLEDFFEELDIENEEEVGDDSATIGGWMMEKIAKYPQCGDEFKYKDLTLRITRCEEMRVLSIEVIRNK